MNGLASSAAAHLEGQQILSAMSVILEFGS